LEQKNAKIVLEDGTEILGISFGAEHSAAGEVVFNTGMVGYPETLTDPSYRGQILVMTYPLIGNYGVPGEERENGILKNFESEMIHVKGLIISDYSQKYSHWDARKSLSEWLKEHNIPALYDIDTRQLTKILRNKGSMLGKIVFNDEMTDFLNPNLSNLVDEVSIKKPAEYKRGKKKIVLVDCGVKNNIIRAFLSRDITVLRVPWDYDFTGENIDGLMLSNGPGNPEMCDITIENVRKMLAMNRPIFGICLGSQILALAAGAKTYKLKFGHRSHNQPCMESGTKRCYITSQNHGYAVYSETLSEDWREWFKNANDGTNEGIIHISKPYFGTQFHPEASPGPEDMEKIFDMFVRAL